MVGVFLVCVRVLSKHVGNCESSHLTTLYCECEVCSSTKPRSDLTDWKVTFNLKVEGQIETGTFLLCYAKQLDEFCEQGGREVSELDSQ